MIQAEWASRVCRLQGYIVTPIAGGNQGLYCAFQGGTQAKGQDDEAGTATAGKAKKAKAGGAAKKAAKKAGVKPARKKPGKAAAGAKGRKKK